MTNKFKIDKAFVSSLDKFIVDFDSKHPEKSASQRKEIKKHGRIAELRDNPNAHQHDSNLWSDF